MEDNVLLVGEPMGLFIANEPGPLDEVGSYDFAVAGAEFNVAVGLTRLGHRASFLTKLGPDPFGDRILKLMEREGIATDQVLRTEGRPTGFMLKSQVVTGDPQIYYYRKGSAASTLCSQDLVGLDLSRCGLVHITGISAALSDSCRAAMLDLAGRAHDAGALVSFDSNLRPQLWASEELMRDVTNELACLADVFLPGINECRVLVGTDDPEKAAAWYLERGCRLVVIKLGAQGAYYADAQGRSGVVPGFVVEKVVDTVGAGDGFAAGVISGLLEGLPVPEAVERGCAVGAVQVTVRGDNDGLPTREELASFMASRPRCSDAASREVA